MDEWTIPTVSWVGWGFWVLTLILERGHLRDRSRIPIGVRDATLVTVILVATLGVFSAMFYPRWISADTTTSISAVRHGVVLAGGIYAFIASVKGRRVARQHEAATPEQGR